jgi:hypothetical protein
MRDFLRCDQQRQGPLSLCTDEGRTRGLLPCGATAQGMAPANGAATRSFRVRSDACRLVAAVGQGVIRRSAIRECPLSACDVRDVLSPWPTTRPRQLADLLPDCWQAARPAAWGAACAAPPVVPRCPVSSPATCRADRRLPTPSERNHAVGRTDTNEEPCTDFIPPLVSCTRLATHRRAPGSGMSTDRVAIRSPGRRKPFAYPEIGALGS